MIVFLDYDGVLHCNEVYLVRRRPVLRGAGTLFEWCRYLEDALASHPQAKIVLSTTWCRVLGYSRAKGFLPPTLQSRVIGSTWHSAMSRSEYSGLKLPITCWDDWTRYEQIMGYVSRANLEDWVAIDDDNDGWAAKDVDRLILTDPDAGISDPHALALLQKKLQGR
jgi:hypothetical protein